MTLAVCGYSRQHLLLSNRSGPGSVAHLMIIIMHKCTDYTELNLQPTSTDNKQVFQAQEDSRAVQNT